MRFAAKEDISAPAGAIFAALVDFDAYERIAVAKGAEVRRHPGQEGALLGTAWDLKFKLRGRMRKVNVKLTACQPPSGMRFVGQSPNLDLTMALTLVALSPNKTRLNVEFEVTPRTLAARIMLQSARLGRSRLTKRFQGRVHGFARLVAAKAGGGLS